MKSRSDSASESPAFNSTVSFRAGIIAAQTPPRTRRSSKPTSRFRRERVTSSLFSDCWRSPEGAHYVDAAAPGPVHIYWVKCLRRKKRGQPSFSGVRKGGCPRFLVTLPNRPAIPPGTARFDRRDRVCLLLSWNCRSRRRAGLSSRRCSSRSHRTGNDNSRKTPAHRDSRIPPRRV